MHHPTLPRRHWLRHSAALLAGTAALSPWAEAFARTSTARPEAKGAQPPYGPLRPVADEATGLPLLMLPEGFSYRSFGWAGSPLSGGDGLIPDAADGMGIVRVQGEVFTLVRNHEKVAAEGSFGPTSSHYESGCSGGTVTLRYDRSKGELLEARGSLSGTLVNCSGGVTPWGSWLSCEEIVTPVGASGTWQRQRYELKKPHGFVFEVPADGSSNAQPLTALGQFRHEAAVVDPLDGTVYLTEDGIGRAGFYRLLPKTPGKLAAGGRLQMLRAKGQPDLRRGLKAGQGFDVDWVDIERPQDGFVPGLLPGSGTTDGVLRQGLAQGGSQFTRLEGLFVGRDGQHSEIFFTSTDGGDAAAGQVWRLLPRQQQLQLFYESPGSGTLDYPDNLCLSPTSGLIVLCEDSKAPVQRLYGLTRQGALFELARNNQQLAGEVNGWRGSFKNAEWAGTCFSPDGRTLFANLYRPGCSVAISGPF